MYVFDLDRRHIRTLYCDRDTTHLVSLRMPPKRKPGQTDGPADDDVQPRRSTRQRTSTAAAREPEAATPKNKTAKKPAATAKKAATPKVKKPKGNQGQGDDGEDGADGERQPPPAGGGAKGVKAEAAQAGSTVAEAETDAVEGRGRQYWLMKAEPESRIENGVDVRFSIDDLAAKSEPEPWDGMLLFHPVTVLAILLNQETNGRPHCTGIRNYVGMGFLYSISGQSGGGSLLNPLLTGHLGPKQPATTSAP
jgi:hypothetical protein